MPGSTPWRRSGSRRCNWRPGDFPDTTGLPTFDGFSSAAAMEPDGVEDHYREALLTLPGIGTSYPRPPASRPRGRADFGLPKPGRLYLFPHSHFKVHPQMDRLLARILARDPAGRLVMFETHERHFWRRLSARMRPRFDETRCPPACRWSRCRAC